jgi:hypothetical protein
MKLHFRALVLGAFWLGTASGFSLFYRHAAVPTGGRGQRTVLLVFGSATLAALISPTLAAKAEALAVPYAFVGIAVAATMAHILTLVCTAALPYRRLRETSAGRPSRPWRSLVLPTAIGTVAWSLMTGLMGATPIAMVGCGLGDAVPGTVAWHIVAMYAPSLALAFAPKAIRPSHVLALGVFLLASAVLIFALSSGASGFSASAILLGIGWTLATLGTT